MSKKERLASSLDKLSDLCFTISELVIGEDSDQEVAKPSTSTLSPEAPAFTPTSVVTTSGPQGSDISALSEDWQDIPSSSESVNTPPTFSQVVGGSQSVFVTPVKKVARAQSVDSASSGITMAAVPGAAAAAAGVPPPPNYATCTAAQFDAFWNALPNEATRIAAENTALQTGNDGVKVAVLLKRDVRNANRMTGLAMQLQQAQAAANAAVVANAVRAQPPPKWENKEKDLNIREWLPMIEDYLQNTPVADYLRMASSYLNGKPRSYWTSQYESFHVQNPGLEPANPRQFFRDTMIRGYGIRDPAQSYWDTWNKLSQGSSSIDEYNVAFEQALTNLRAEITDEQVKIEKYRAGLQSDLREMCRTSPDGTRWQTLNALATYATLQWPTVEARIAKRKASQPSKSQPSKQVAGKRKASGGSGPIKSSKARVNVVLSEEQLKYNLEHRLCHKCGKPGHIAADCTEKSQNKGKGKAKQDKSGEDF